MLVEAEAPCEAKASSLGKSYFAVSVPHVSAPPDVAQPQLQAPRPCFSFLLDFRLPPAASPAFLAHGPSLPPASPLLRESAIQIRDGSRKCISC